MKKSMTLQGVEGNWEITFTLFTSGVMSASFYCTDTGELLTYPKDVDRMCSVYPIGYWPNYRLPPANLDQDTLF